MTNVHQFSLKTIPFDFTAGFVVFLVAIPLCLGVSIASNAPLFSGILAGVIGGIIVGCCSGSSTSVSGPAAGLIAVVASQIHTLGSFEAFLVAVLIAGLFQVVFGLCRMGFISAFIPSSVIKGLLFAIGVILIYKQIPLVFGHEADPLGNDAFIDAGSRQSFSEYIETVFGIHPGTALVGLSSIILLLLWDKISLLKNISNSRACCSDCLSHIFGLFIARSGRILGIAYQTFCPDTCSRNIERFYKSSDIS